MKVVILAGGLGTRLSEETGVLPKPMVEIGGRPILWHIMKLFSAQGFNEFVVCCGYKGYVIKEYFSNYALHNSDITFDIANQSVEVHQNYGEPWRVTLVNTGEGTMTGGRLKRVRKHVENDKFIMTYGDGLGDVDLAKLLAFHESAGAIATVTATQPPGRWGILELAGDKVTAFREKVVSGADWINAGFFVLSPEVIDYIDGDTTSWEREPLERLASEGRLSAYRHPGFWQPMDTLRDKVFLEQLWQTGKAPWKIWT